MAFNVRDVQTVHVSEMSQHLNLINDDSRCLQMSPLLSA